MRMELPVLLVVGAGVWMAGCDGCGDSGKPPVVDARPEAAAMDVLAEAAIEAAPAEVLPPDAMPDAAPEAGDAAPIVHSCGMFSTPSMWTTAPGFRSAVVKAGMPLSMPVALSFAAGPYGESAYVVDQGAGAVFKVDTSTGAVTEFVAKTAWPRPPVLLTTSLWDAEGAFDGRLYVGDQGGNGDSDSVIFRVDAAGTPTVFAMGPGAGMDDIYGLAFSPGGAYPAGLYVSGDTDGSGPGFGRFDAAGTVTTFAMFAGVEGLAIDRLNRFGGGLFASMPAGGGYSGDDTISKINADGTKGAPLVMSQPGIHAIVFAPNGPFGGDAYAASWATGTLLRIAPGGTVSDLATGLSLTEYDGNILSFSPDGRVLFVADRAQARIVCIEPM